MKETLLLKIVRWNKYLKHSDWCRQTGSELTPALRQPMADIIEMMADVQENIAQKLDK